MSSLALVDDVSIEPSQVQIDLGLAANVIETLRAGGILETSGVSLTLDPGTPYEQYEQLGAALGLVNRSCAWWVGDWLVFGEGAFPERYSQAQSVTGLAEQTLLNRVYVCKNVPPSRRKPSLSFSTHALVAPLPAREQKAWLDRAERGGWTRAQLAAEMKARRRDERPQLPVDEEKIELAVVIEAVHSLLANADDAGENVICRREDVARLRAAIGEES